jgi:hypothetical protein
LTRCRIYKDRSPNSFADDKPRDCESSVSPNMRRFLARK